MPAVDKGLTQLADSLIFLPPLKLSWDRSGVSWYWNVHVHCSDTQNSPRACGEV